MLLSRILFSVLVVGFVLGPHALGGPQVGTITRMDGAVKLLQNPSSKVDGPPPHVLFEQRYYSAKDATIGDRLENGNILRTAPGSKARIVFDNGDQINVGSGTAYEVSWTKDTEKGEAKINLMYGKIRAVVGKGGPRTNLRVKTRSATMGVRGTDFFIADKGMGGGGTEVSVLRGEVAVKPEAAPSAAKEAKVAKKPTKEIPVKAGFSADVPPPPVPEEVKREVAKKEEKAKPEAAPEIAVRQTTKQELVAIQHSSTVQKKDLKEEVKEGDKKEVAQLEKKIEELEKTAVTQTLQDIKKEDPKLYAELQTRKIASTEEINTQAVTKILKTAPEAPKWRKPFYSEIEDLEDGLYEKYFQSVDD